MADAFLLSFTSFGSGAVIAAAAVRDAGRDRPQVAAQHEALFESSSKDEVAAKIPFSLLRSNGDGSGGGFKYYFTKEARRYSVVKDHDSSQLLLWSGVGANDFDKRKPDWLAANVGSAIVGVLSLGEGKAGPAASLVHRATGLAARTSVS